MATLLKKYKPLILGLVTLFLVISLLLRSNKTSSHPSLLIIDSGFAPQGDDCWWLSDANVAIPQKGACFDAELWSSLAKQDAELLSSYLNSPNEQWTAYKNKNPNAEQMFSLAFDLNAHGAMVEEVAMKVAPKNLKIARLRNIGSQAGAFANQTDFNTLEPGLNRLSTTCPLIDWDKVANFSMEPDEQRIADRLSQDKSIRIVNVSAGIRKSWIREDLPGCSEAQAQKDFEANFLSWSNLMKSFPNVLFVVSAGNESRDLSKPEEYEDLIWARLSEQANLVIVGALNKDNIPFRSNNFGLKSMLWAPGDFVLDQPNPKSAGPTSIRFFGTSAAAPHVSGFGINVLQKNPAMSVAELKTTLSEHFSMPHK